MVCSNAVVTMPERSEQIEKHLQHYKGWILPNPPSQDANDDDPFSDEPAAQDPDFFSWKRDLNNIFPTSKSPKNTTSYIEWKTTSKSRKKKKNNRVDEASCQSTVLTSEGKVNVRRAKSSSSRSLSRTPLKENAPPSFRPAFSQSRYTKQQKFKSLTSYYKEKIQTASRQDESLEGLVAIKMELSDLKEWSKKKRDKSKSKRVQFAHPLISSLNYRPKTLADEVDVLYFREDELLDWEEDRETTSSERFELTISGEEEHIAISADCRSYSSVDSHSYN